MRETSDSRSCWKVPGAHTLLMSEGDERFHRNGLKRKKIRDAGESAGKGSRPPRSESDGDRTLTINFCDGL